MSDREHTTIERLQSIMTDLLRKRLEESLGSVEVAIGQWRDGELGVFEAHSELLRHAARAESLAERMARLGLDNASLLLRDAFDAGLLDRSEFIDLVGKEPETIEVPQVSSESEGLTTSNLPNKRDVVEELMSGGPVLLHIDATKTGISVPDNFRSDPKLVLRFGYGLTPAIIDLSLDEECISGTLTFSGIPHRCVLPWSAVYAVISEVAQRGMVWPDGVPAAVVEELTGVEIDPADDSDELPVSDETKKRPSHLKLVK